MINKVILLGRLGQDPELRHTPSGGAVCNFSMATSESYKDKATGEKKQNTEWHRIVVWSQMGENCHKYLKKGSQIFLEGKIQTRSWDDKNGQKRYSTEVLASNVQFLDRRDDQAQDYSQGYQNANNYQASSSPQPSSQEKVDQGSQNNESQYLDVPF